MQIKILLIIPAYNEEENIVKTCKTIMEYNKKKAMKLDFIVINDGSTDKTKKLLEENNFPHINLVHNLGIGGAVQTGYMYAYKYNYDIAIQFDGDNQHDVNYVEKLIKPILEGKKDFTIGSRFVENISEFKTSKMRRIGISILTFFIKITTGFVLLDTTSGFRAASKPIIRKFALNYPVEYPEPITTVELLKDGYRIEEIGVNMKERQGGSSSIHTWKDAYYMISVCLSILIAAIRRQKKCP